VSPVSRLLDRLEHVRQTAPGRWIARCPAHEDRSPSLSIRETDDSRTLLYCFAGCETDAVLSALGLTLGDLFEKALGDFAPSQSTIPARDLLMMLDHELIVAVLILNDITQRRSVNEGQVRRLIQATARVGKARDMANPARVSRHAA
jgi:hypothetical protein